MRGIADPQRIGAVTANYPAFQADNRVLVLIIAAAALCSVRLSNRIGARWALMVVPRAARPLERRAPHPVQPAGARELRARCCRQAAAGRLGLYRVLSNEYQGLENHLASQRVRSALIPRQRTATLYELLGGKNAGATSEAQPASCWPCDT
jgi:hypothetical protein